MFVKILVDIILGDLKYFFFINSGIESVEVVLKLVKMYSDWIMFIFIICFFYGKSLGFLLGMVKGMFCKLFLLLILGFCYVLFGDIDMMCKIFEMCVFVGEDVVVVLLELI